MSNQDTIIPYAGRPVEAVQAILQLFVAKKSTNHYVNEVTNLMIWLFDKGVPPRLCRSPCYPSR